MARRPPLGIAASSPPREAERHVEPRFQLEESAIGFRYKQTDSDTHQGATPLDSLVDRPPTASWTAAVQSPGIGRRQPAIQGPTYACRHSTVPAALNTTSPAGELKPGRQGKPAARAMARRPPPGIAAPQPAQRGRKTALDSSAGREVEPAITGRSQRALTGVATAPNQGTVPAPDAD